MPKPIDDRRSPSEAIDRLFRRQAIETPGATAIVHGRCVLSYAELDARANQFAVGLLRRTTADVGPVILFSGRSAELVPAILGTVRAGRPFAIFDAAYPPERLRRQAEVLSPSIVVNVGGSPEAVREAFPSTAKLPTWDWSSEDARHGHGDPGAIRETPSPTAYLLFTSGTTGTPKCIRTGHAPLLHFLEFYRRRFQPQRSDRFSMLSGLGHDPILRDIFVPLSCGACIVVPEQAIIRSPRDLYAWLADAKITFMHLTPQLLRLVVAGRDDRAPLNRLTHVFSGGDTLLGRDVEALRSVAPNASLVNFYGASETPQAMGYHLVRPEDRDATIPLGRGIDDVQLLVMDDGLREVGVGQVGQIAIRTRFLSDGYVGDPNETRSKFIVSPPASDRDERTYLTGDLGYQRPDGALVWAGRKDEQVKIRGYRVEPVEVERALEETGLVNQATVLVRTGAAGEPQLVAFVVPSTQASAPGQPAITEALRAHLGTSLPAPMVPSRYIVLDAIPLTPNGKVDRAALLARLVSTGLEHAPSLRTDPSLDEPLRVLIEILEDELEIPITNLDASFIDLGGDSLSYVRACTAVQDAIGFLPRDWASRPLRDFSALVAGAKQAGPRRSTWTSVELPVFLRALAIVLVVANHAHVGPYIAATTTLFVLSGASFGRFLSPAIMQTGRLAPALRFVAKLALPAFCWHVLQAVKAKALWWPDLFLLGTFFQNPERPWYGLWFLDVLGINALMLALVLKAVRAFRPTSPPGSNATSHFAASVFMVVIACLVAEAQMRSGWWNGEVGFASVAPFKWFWMLALGLAISGARSLGQRLVASGLTLAIVMFARWAAAGTLGAMDGVNLFFLVAVGLLPWIRTIPVPRLVQRPLVVIASSTLFIYIVNYTVIYTVMPRLGLSTWPRLAVGLSIVAGIVTAWTWTRTQRFAHAILIRLRTKLVKDAPASEQTEHHRPMVGDSASGGRCHPCVRVARARRSDR